jgi:hypothetical protein
MTHNTPVPARAVVRHPTRYPWSLVLALFVVVTAGLSAVVSAVDTVKPSAGGTGQTWIDGWFQFDSGWYAGIAQNGYSYTPGQQSAIAFFPVYPLLVRAVTAMVGDVQLAGQLVALVSGLAAVLLVGLWAWQRLPRRAALLTIGVTLTYPYTLFLHGTMYADGLYLLLAVGAFILVDRRWYLAAGLVGALAAASRPFGIAVAVGLVVRILETLAQETGRTGWRDLVVAIRRVRVRHAGVLVSFAGLLAWMAYLGAEFGNPLAFVETESSPGWNQGVGPRTWFKIAYLGILHHQRWALAANLTLQALACVAVVLLVRRVTRLFGWGYAAYTLVVIAIPILGTKDFMGAGRYALAAFPALAAGGDWLAERPRWVAVLTLIAMTAAMVVLTWYFANGVEVS